MAEPCDLTVLILTLDEERHIERCIKSVYAIASRVVVIDSGSNDQTCSIARRLGAEVLVHPFVTHARQLNWALQHAGIRSTWVMKLDADEYLVPGFDSVLRARLSRPDSPIDGFNLRRRRIFMGQWLRHGGLYPIWLLRIWRQGAGECEDRWMDEHIVVKGRVDQLPVDFADDNLNSITWWTEKHNRYASREVLDLLLAQRASNSIAVRLHGQARTKRWLKRNFYGRLPLGLRAFLYFLYRYLLKLGFLDGWRGFVFHFLQGCWYRTLVDVKIREMNLAMDQVPIDIAVRDVLGINTAPTDWEAHTEDIDHHRGVEPAGHHSECS